MSNNSKSKQKKKSARRSKRDKYVEMRTIKVGKDNPVLMPYITGKLGQSHDDIVAKASHHDVELGTKDVDYHYGLHPKFGNNELHGGPSAKCLRCSEAPRASSDISNIGKFTKYYVLETPGTISDPKTGYVPSEEYSTYYTLVHIRDVQHLMFEIIEYMMSDVLTHDWSKIEHSEEFHNAIKERVEGKSFRDTKWLKFHVGHEKHHVIPYPGDSYLMDVIHMFCDWSAASFARGGTHTTLEESLKMNDTTVPQFKDLLYKIAENTLEFIQSQISLVPYPSMSKASEISDEDKNVPISADDKIKIGSEPAEDTSNSFHIPPEEQDNRDEQNPLPEVSN